MAIVSTLPTFTLSQIFNQIDGGNEWAPQVINYSMTGAPRTVAAYTADNQVAASTNIVGMSATQMAMAQLAFELWDDVIARDLTLTNNSDTNITFNYTSMAPNPNGIAQVFTLAGQTDIARAYVWFPNSNGFEVDANIVFGDWHFGNYVHEIGHTLGLRHPGTYDSSAVPPPTYANAAYSQDTMQYTIMSYWTPENYDNAVDYVAGGVNVVPQTPMIHDLMIVQTIYGADLNTRTGSTVYGFNTNVVMPVAANPFNFNQNDDPVLTIWDAGGLDTLDVSGFNGNQVIDLRPGSFSSVGNTDAGTGNLRLTSNVAVAMAVDSSGRIQGINPNFDPGAVVNWIENAIGGSGNDTITGNDAANLLDQGGGGGAMQGGNGNDILVAGPGAETIDGGNDFDTVDYSRSTSEIQIDTTIGKVVGGWATGDTLVSIEQVIGTDFDDNIAMGAEANTIFGGSGGDRLDGGAGPDELFGGPGNDTLHGGPGADLIGGGSGADQFNHLDIATFSSAVTINLQTGQHTGEAEGDTYASIEQFNGSPDPDTMIASLLQDVRFAGGDGADVLIGGDQSDWLQGGRGGDYLDGGDGFSDTASYADATRAITVDMGFTDGTTDGKVVAGDWGFDTLVSIESVEGTGFSDYMVGDERDNQFFGLGDNDYLQGGTGNDTLTGGTGADIYAFRTGDGTDTIKDFNAAEGDKLDLSGTGLTFSDLQNQGRITQSGSSTIITLGSGLVLENVVATTLTAAQFLFNTPTDIVLSPASVAETSPVGTVVGALSATDPDAGETFTFELLENAGGLFSIDGANLVVAGALDYETATSHPILVQVTDSDGNFYREAITVGVIDFNVEANPDTYSTDEDTALTVVGPGVLANDTDDDGDPLSAILVSGPAHGSLTLNDDGSFTYTPAANYNGADSFRYQANDGTADSNLATVSITVNSVNDAPVIQSGGGGDEATYFVRVNNRAITTVVATDVDNGDEVTYSIVGGTDQGEFFIDSDTGELSFNSLPTRANRSYFVDVQADDRNGGIDVQAITVNVTADQMIAEIDAQADTFVFHAGFGANTVRNFDVAIDFLQFDTGMFDTDTAAAVLAAAHETRQGDVIIDTHAGHLELVGVTVAQLQAHPGDFLFV